jgi:membrane protein implicated in regulation of membrane protease activity
MIYLYIFALIVGGLLLGASLLLGGHGDHADHVEVGHGHDATANSAGDPQGIESFMLWLLSARFWTFFAAFFGITGVILDGFGVVGHPIVAAVLAVGMGLFAGLFASWLVKTMTAESSNSSATTADYIGKTGRLLVGFGPGATGKIRLEVKGSTIDLLCTAMDDGTYETRDEVLVVEMDGTKAKVARTRISTP